MSLVFAPYRVVDTSPTPLIIIIPTLTFHKILKAISGDYGAGRPAQEIPSESGQSGINETGVAFIVRMIITIWYWHGNSIKRSSVSFGSQRSIQTTARSRTRAERDRWPHRLRGHQVYKEHGISGAKGPRQTPGIRGALPKATKRQFDVVMAWFKELEAEVSNFRDRAARAEEWLQQISRDRLQADRSSGRLAFTGCS